MLKYRFIVWGSLICAVLFIGCSLLLDFNAIWQVLLSWLLGGASITVALYYTDKLNRDL